MPIIFNTLETIPEDIWKKPTVFLVGPSARDQHTCSYRENFIEYLTQVEKELGNGVEFVIFNPEIRLNNTNFTSSARECNFADWELKRLEQSAIIVVGLNNNNDTLPGLTTRTEVGFLLCNRRNLILWRPNESYKTGYIANRFKEREYLWMTDNLKIAAELVPQVWKSNKEMIQIRNGEFGAIEIRPNGCDLYYPEMAIREAEQNNDKAIYIYLPLLDTFNYGTVVTRIGGYMPFIQTVKYNVIYKWNNKTLANPVPEPGTSIAGAFGMFFSPDETECLLIYETKYGKSLWGFVGGAVNRGELDTEAFQREVMEEIGISIDVNYSTFIVGGYNQKKARTYGVWDGDDPPVYMNDHFTVYLIHIPRDTEFTIDNNEIEQIKWFPIDDVINDRIPNMNQYNRKMVIEYTTHKRKLQCNKSKPTTVKFN